MKRSLEPCLALVACVAGSVAVALEPGASTRHPYSRPPQLAVLNIELTGDPGGPELAAGHEARLRMATAKLREELERSRLTSGGGSGPIRCS
ncbi:MAG TPA: hypothetical protein VJ011_07105 [Steroidobacteraceae bacterium]|nr:hypothetical protein [Steroidobacteraceae bacterium]